MLQSNAEMSGEGGSHMRRDILRGTSFYGLSAGKYMRDLQFLHGVNIGLCLLECEAMSLYYHRMFNLKVDR
jgi:hypothetical protein